MDGNILVVLGAGASHDVVDFDNPYPAQFIEKKNRPPLTSQLFAIEEFPGTLLPDYPVVRELAAIIRYKSKTQGLEAALKQLRDSEQPHRRSQMGAVPLFLREALDLASREYVTEPVNYTHLIGDLLDNYVRVGFLTLNYDTLLDRALTKSGYWGPPLRDPPSYIRERWLLVKLHGSVNWGRKFTFGKNINVSKVYPHGLYDAYVQLFSDWPFPGELSDYIVALRSRSDFFSSADSLYFPALSLPVKGKYEYNCPSSHVNELSKFLPTCETVLVIGCSGKDAHVLELLARNLKNVSSVSVVCKGRVPEGDLHPADAFLQGIPQLAAAASFKRFDTGFTNFLEIGGVDLL